MNIRFVKAAAGDAPCNTCCRSTPYRQDQRKAVWFLYFGNHNAVPMCAAHAIYELGCIWSLGDTVTIEGTSYEAPAPLAAALAQQAEAMTQ